MTKPVKLVSLAIATPEHIILQTEASETATQLFSDRYKEVRHLTNAGITKRYAARPLGWFTEPHGWQDRMAGYEAGQLFVKAATLALARAGLSAADVDCMVTVSSTGVVMPSLEARHARQMGFRTDIERVPVFGLGYAAGVSGFGIATRMAKGRPGAVVLFVSIELCSLALRLDELTRPNIIATALFGDGAAACILSTEGKALAEVESTGEHHFPDALGITGWRIDETGFGIILEQSQPPFAQDNIKPAITAILERVGLTIADIDRFICQPSAPRG